MTGTSCASRSGGAEAVVGPLAVRVSTLNNIDAMTVGEGEKISIASLQHKTNSRLRSLRSFSSSLIFAGICLPSQ